MADSYAALEWERFERALPPEPAPKPEVAPRADPAPAAPRADAPAAPQPDAPARIRGVASDQPKAAAPSDQPKAAAPSPTPAEKRPATDPGWQVQKTAAAPLAVETASNHVGCRRSCSLKERSCLARCRDQPITGGGYDACTYECQDASVGCRGTCDMPTP
jgi:hypothetical protein